MIRCNTLTWIISLYSFLISAPCAASYGNSFFMSSDIEATIRVQDIKWFKGELTGLPQSSFEAKWKAFSPKASRITNTKGFIWYKIILLNNKEKKDIVFRHPATLVKEITVYKKESLSFHKIGKALLDAKASYIFPLEPGKNELWVKIKSDIDRLDFSLTTTIGMLKESTKNHWLYGGILFLIFVTALTSIFFAYYFKSYTIALYSLTCFSSFLFLFIQSGLSRLLFSTDFHKAYNSQLLGFSTCAVVAFSALYFLELLELRKQKTKPELITASLLIGYTAILGLLFLFNIHSFSPIHSHTMTFFSCLIGLYFILSKKKRTREFTCISIGWIILFCHTIIFILYVRNIVSDNWYFSQSIFIGYAWQIIFFNLGVLFRVDGLRRRQVEKIHKAARETKTRVQIQSLLHVVCHDIANPLSVIDGQLQIAKIKMSAGKSFEGNLQKAQNGCRRIENIMQMVRMQEAIRTGKYKTDEKSSANLFACIKETIGLFEEKAAGKKIKISADRDDSFSTVNVRADATILVYCIFANIVSNAIKFSPKESEIKIFGEVLDKTARITFKDKGPGIPEPITIL